MPKKTGTATEFVLETLRKYPENELQVADLHRECEGRFTKPNLINSLTRLLQEGIVVRTTDADRTAWWAISVQGLRAAPAVPAIARAKVQRETLAPRKQQPAPPAPAAKPSVPATPASMTDAAKQFVLDTLKAAGQPMTLLDMLGHRKHSDKHVSMRTLKLATFYLVHEGKLMKREEGDKAWWALQE